MDDGIAIKGIREGLLLTIDPGGEWAELTSRLAIRIDQQRGFFKGARVALDVGSRPVRPHELDSLKALLTKREVTLWAVVSDSATTQNSAHNLGLETSLITRQEQLEVPEIKSDEDGEAGLVISHTLRSGRSVHYDGHVVVYGDVNPGAAIVAGGNVIVWGRLRGTVHAGAHGNEDAVVCALDLAPTQLRIAGYITIAPDDKRRKPRPEIASVRAGRIVAEAWTG
ncbi:MAG TPA: septum site-determining protein MinC [Aggregatilineales bacterium]|nr:septum site-determining protein MinC [Aggregatilineales bacterium]